MTIASTTVTCLSSRLRADPTIDHAASYDPVSFELTGKWMRKELQRCQLDYQHCIDSAPLYNKREDLEGRGKFCN